MADTAAPGSADVGTKKRPMEAAAATDKQLASDQPPSVRQKQSPALNFIECIDPDHENKSLKEIIEMHPGVLQGLREGVADKMLSTLGVKTIADLGRWKYYRLARAILVLSETEVEGKRPEGSTANVNSGVDKAFEGHSFKQLLEAPPSALQGLAAWTDTTLAQLRIKTIKDLAVWKYCRWAEALVMASEFENAKGSSG